MSPASRQAVDHSTELAQRIAEQAGASDVAIGRLPDIMAVRVSMLVPDMVVPLQRWRVTIDDYALDRGGHRAFAEAMSDAFGRIAEEREVRRWSACDL